MGQIVSLNITHKYPRINILQQKTNNLDRSQIAFTVLHGHDLYISNLENDMLVINIFRGAHIFRGAQLLFTQD